MFDVVLEEKGTVNIKMRVCHVAALWGPRVWQACCRICSATQYVLCNSNTGSLRAGGFSDRNNWGLSWRKDIWHLKNWFWTEERPVRVIGITGAVIASNVSNFSNRRQEPKDWADESNSIFRKRNNPELWQWMLPFRYTEDMWTSSTDQWKGA